MRGGPRVSALTGRNIWNVGPATHTAVRGLVTHIAMGGPVTHTTVGGWEPGRVGKRTPAQEQWREAGSESSVGPCREVLSICPHGRPCGVDPKTSAHVHSSSTRGRAGQRAGRAQSNRQWEQDRTGPRLPKPQLHPVLPPHPGEGGAVASGPRGTRRAGVGGPAVAREPCPQCCPLHGSSGPVYKPSPPHTSHPTATSSPCSWPQS